MFGPEALPKGLGFRPEGGRMRGDGLAEVGGMRMMDPGGSWWILGEEKPTACSNKPVWWFGFQMVHKTHQNTLAKNLLSVLFQIQARR